jgi:hypothetical protein
MSMQARVARAVRTLLREESSIPVNMIRSLSPTTTVARVVDYPTIDNNLGLLKLRCAVLNDVRV